MNKEQLDINTFNSIGKLEIMYADTDARNAEIYANGKNQAHVRVRVLLQDSNGNPVSDIPEETIRSVVYLCDYQTGVRLDNKDDPESDSVKLMNYSYTLNKDENFCHLISSSAGTSAVSYNNSVDEIMMTDTGDTPGVLKQNGAYLVDLYVTASDSQDASQLMLACGLSTNAGDFNTSSMGTSTVLKNGSPFSNPAFIGLGARNKIDYSDPKNIHVEGGWESAKDFEVISNQMERYHEARGDLGFLVPKGHTDYCNTSSKAELTLSPSGSNHYFIDKFTTQTEKTVSLAGVNIHGGGADFIYSKAVTNQGANTSFVFINKSTYGLDIGGQIKYYVKEPLKEFDCNYHVKDKNSSPWKHAWDTPLPEGKLRIVYCNHWLTINDYVTFIKSIDLYRHWSDPREGTDKKVTYHVTDQYGNSGQLIFTALATDWPRLRLNGHLIGKNNIT